MPLPTDPFESLVASLSKGARAAYPFIRGLAVSQPDLSATSIYNQLQAAGFPLRKQTTLDIVAVLRNKSDLVRFQRTFGSNAIIPDSLHTYSPVGFLGGARVQYLVRIKSNHPLVPEAIYVNAKNNLSIDQVFGAAIATVTGYSAGPLAGVVLENLTDLTIEEARYRPGEQTTGDFPVPEL